MTQRLPFRFWLPWFVLLTCGALTVMGTASIAQSQRSRDRLRMDATAQDVAASIGARVDTYLALLRSGTALFAASQRVTRDEFRQFISHLDLRDRFPGIQGIGYARRVDAAGVGALEAEMRAAGIESFAAGGGPFTIWPREPARPTYTAIVYLEPLDAMNRQALGYDMFSEPIRHAAMERAAREARPIASGRVTLVQERASPDAPQPGFLIYAPLYRGGRVPTSPDERIAALDGFIYAPFRAGDLLRTVFTSSSHAGVLMRLHDGEPGPSTTLFESSPGRAAPASGLRVRRSLEVAGRTWIMDVVALPEFASASAGLVPSLLVLGLAVSVLLFMLTRAEGRTRASLERHALELARSEQALREASRAKDEFLATLSHELRTPLNAILGWTRLLRTGHLEPARQDAALAVVERNARAQAQLVEDILDVSRIITGKLRLDLAVVPVNPIVEDAVASARPAADAKGVALECHLDPAAGTIVAAADRVQQIAWNLLSNAIKFTPAGGGVRVATSRSASAVTLEVRDDGIGIEPSFLPHVFDRFTQANSTTTRAHTGVGLGLAIVRHLVELHGGTIEARSDGPGRGAAFSVVFPVRAPATDDRPTDAPANAVAAQPGAGPLTGLSVLVVDDDADARTMLATALAFEGAEVRDAATVEDAIVSLSRRDADVVVTDVAMPGEDGYALVRRLRESPAARLRGLPVVAVTAYARAGDRETVLAHGFQGFVAKPVDLPSLVASIRDLAPARRTR